uniref:Solute carrier family 35 member F3-like n=1 Tax=Phallusia mammillata TaxID=59560 RepID=A0A6F9DTP3_9ASCI|nr:solute carrier family 35 member F3-like [Phallusia mammillata]
MSAQNKDDMFMEIGASFNEQDCESVLPKQNNNENGDEETPVVAESPTNTTRKTLIGLVIVILLALSWVGSQQLAQSANTTSDFNAPFFTTWFSTCWMVLCYPVYCLFLRISTNRSGFVESIKDSLLIFGPENVSLRQILTIIFPFNLVWIVTNYLYIFALTYIAATDASAILSSNVAFVYIFSFFLLGERFYFIRIIASLTCIAGVVLFGYADGFSEQSNVTTGIIMAIFSALGAAVYKVVFKKVVGNASLGQVSLFLSFLGITNALFLWIVFLILYFVGLEHIVAAEIPWSYLCGSSALSLVFNFLVNFGIAFTFPLFISIAMMMGIPVNAAVDLFLRGVLFSVLRLVAALLVVCGFCLMMLPDTWNLPIHRLLGCTSYSRCYSGDQQESEDERAIAYSSGSLKRESAEVNKNNEE